MMLMLWIVVSDGRRQTGVHVLASAVVVRRRVAAARLDHRAEARVRTGSLCPAWITEQKHVSGSLTYDSRKYVIAKATRLVLVHQYASMCDGQPCIRTDAEHTLECMTDETDNKYRVRRLAHGFVARPPALCCLSRSRALSVSLPPLRVFGLGTHTHTHTHSN